MLKFLNLIWVNIFILVPGCHISIQASKIGRFLQSPQDAIPCTEGLHSDFKTWHGNGSYILLISLNWLPWNSNFTFFEFQNPDKNLNWHIQLLLTMPHGTGLEYGLGSCALLVSRKIIVVVSIEMLFTTLKRLWHGDSITAKVHQEHGQFWGNFTALIIHCSSFLLWYNYQLHSIGGMSKECQHKYQFPGQTIYWVLHKNKWVLLVLMHIGTH